MRGRLTIKAGRWPAGGFGNPAFHQTKLKYHVRNDTSLANPYWKQRHNRQKAEIEGDFRAFQYIHPYLIDFPFDFPQ